MVAKYMILWWNFDNFALILLGTITRGFSQLLITNFEIKTLRIQYGGQVMFF